MTDDTQRPLEGSRTAPAVPAAEPTGAPRRNILMLMTDQHRVDTLGCYGSTTCRTPNLDALAATGTRFDSWFTPSAICTPARASLFTGAAPFRHKLLANHERNVGYIEDLPEDQWTLPEELRAQGYQCGLVGKWHVGEERTAATSASTPSTTRAGTTPSTIPTTCAGSRRTGTRRIGSPSVSAAASPTERWGT